MKLTQIKPNPNNPRIIKDDKFKKLVQSLKDFPEMLDAREIVVNKDHVILGGNMRYKAAKEAGFTEIPVKVVDWSEEKQREFIAKDNASFGEWDWDVLANEWDAEELDEWGIDVPESLEPEQEIEEDEAPEVSSEPPVSKVGEIYQLGRHRVMCGDSTKDDDVEALVDTQTIHLVLTDPPYGIKRDKGFTGSRAFGGGKGKAIASKRYEGDWDSSIPPKECFDLMLSLSDKCIIFGGNFFAHILPQGNHWIVWDKKNTMPTFSDAELAWTNIKRDSVKVKEFLYNGLVGKEKEKREHATQKPVGLMAEIIEDYSDTKEYVADLFLGSGTTLIACEQTDRTCYGMELDPKYCDVIRKRYARFTSPDNKLPENWEELTPKVSK